MVRAEGFLDIGVVGDNIVNRCLARSHLLYRTESTVCYSKKDKIDGSIDLIIINLDATLRHRIVQ